MKKLIAALVLLCAIILTSCTSGLRGEYICESRSVADSLVAQSNDRNRNADTTAIISTLDLRCLFTSLDFVDSKRVIVKTMNAVEQTTTYTIHKNKVRIKMDQVDIVFDITSNNTLQGEGLADGTMKKK